MQRNLLLLVSLPLTTALSLANFQDITSVLIPITCQLVYDSTIPKCTVADFAVGAVCSDGCAEALTSVAESVSQACSNVNVNSNTLLGIVKNGGILQALCPKLQTSSTAIHNSAQPTAADSVTLPTASPGVIVSTTSSKSASSKSTPIAQSEVTTSTSSKSTSRASSSRTVESTSVESTTSAPASASTESTDDGSDSGITTPASTLDFVTTTSKTTSSTKKAESKPDSGSGGGSPFDISSNDGHRVGRGSIFTFVVAAMASFFLGQ